jgi:hypothetical protein
MLPVRRKSDIAFDELASRYRSMSASRLFTTADQMTSQAVGGAFQRPNDAKAFRVEDGKRRVVY